MSAEQNHVVPMHHFIVWFVPQNCCNFGGVRAHDFQSVRCIVIGQSSGNLPAILIDDANGVSLFKRAFHRFDACGQQAGTAALQSLGAASVNNQTAFDPRPERQPTFAKLQPVLPGRE